MFSPPLPITDCTLNENIANTTEDKPPNLPTEVDTQTEPVVTATQRHSTRERRAPCWLNDYVNVSVSNNLVSLHRAPCGLDSPTDYTQHTYPYINSGILEPTYVNFLANISAVCEPCSYSQAVKDIEWVQAMEKELQALEKNRTWEVTELPPNKQAIGCRWVYKINFRADRSIDCYKARLVAKEYH